MSRNEDSYKETPVPGMRFSWRLIRDFFYSPFVPKLRSVSFHDRI